MQSREEIEAYYRMSEAKYAAYPGYYRKWKPWKTLLSGARQRALKRGLSFTLTDAWAKARYAGVCELSGVAFNVEGTGRSGFRALSPSIDRIDQTRGYEPENCRFILTCLNMFRGSMNDEQMLAVAKALIDARAKDQPSCLLRLAEERTRSLPHQGSA